MHFKDSRVALDVSRSRERIGRPLTDGLPPLRSLGDTPGVRGAMEWSMLAGRLRP